LEDGSQPSSSPEPVQKQISRNPFNIKEQLLNRASQVVGNTIKGLYQKLESEGFSAGEEFIVAVREGLNVGSKIILGDQDVEITLRRLTEALSKTDIKKLLAADAEIEQNMKQLIPPDVAKSVSGASSGEMSKEEFAYFVETIKAKENVKILMASLKSVAPEVYQAMVGERDIYMANGLDRLNQFDSIVAVMGVAHVDGVERTLKERGWEEIKYPLCF
jgi:pheromone shutdown protein TraB